jgi:predicted mannosyl-3-phosphoglycerate phosphatase (HAD superfamily)
VTSRRRAKEAAAVSRDARVRRRQREADERIADFDPHFRYRLYCVVEGRGVWVAGAGCADREAIGALIETMHDDGEITDTESIGLLDTEPWSRGLPGRWLINPYAKPR